MGANMINTMAEAVKPYLESITDGKAVMGILSNYATECLATATCQIPVKYLERRGHKGEDVRDGIIEANKIALEEPYWANTKNKGIMNGLHAQDLDTCNES